MLFLFLRILGHQTAAIGSMLCKMTIVYCFAHLMSSMTSSILVDSLFRALEYLVDAFYTEGLAVPLIFLWFSILAGEWLNHH